MKKIFILIFTLLTTLTNFSQNSTEIAKIGIKSTVSVLTFDKFSQPLGQGSGFIIGDELIATNVHVMKGCSSASVFMNGNEKKYSVKGYVAIDKNNDLVILKVQGLQGDNLELNSDEIPEIGERVFAIGNPKGFEGTFSEGVISGIREISANQILQITAPISPGSSGGPILNSDSKVIGVSFASFTSGQNINFAIPIKYLSKLKEEITQLIPLSNFAQSPKSSPTSGLGKNIKDGVVIRQLELDYHNSPWGQKSSERSGIHSFSILNNINYAISDVKILFMSFDTTGILVDSAEYIVEEEYEKIIIKPYLAKVISKQQSCIQKDSTLYCYDGITCFLYFKPGYKVVARLLDFKINED
jgi:hypothetical protein